MNMRRLALLFAAIPFAISAQTAAQAEIYKHFSAIANYDEAVIPAYELPDPLIANDGHRVTTAEEWTEKRRPELLSMFEKEMFGKSPNHPE